MLNKIKQMFIESFKGSTGKLDHKRLTVFAFVIMFAITLGIVLYKKNEIPNKALVEYAMITMTSVILGGMGLTKLKNKDTKNETE